LRFAFQPGSVPIRFCFPSRVRDRARACVAILTRASIPTCRVPLASDHARQVCCLLCFHYQSSATPRAVTSDKNFQTSAWAHRPSADASAGTTFPLPPLLRGQESPFTHFFCTEHHSLDELRYPFEECSVTVTLLTFIYYGQTCVCSPM